MKDLFMFCDFFSWVQLAVLCGSSYFHQGANRQPDKIHSLAGISQAFYVQNDELLRKDEGYIYCTCSLIFYYYYYLICLMGDL